VAADLTSASKAVMPDATLAVNFRHGPTFGNDAKPPILGFGGAFTEASALNFKSLTAQGQTAVVDLLFGQNGLGYSMGRVHMNSCDFCVASYSFDTNDGDFQLDHFDHEVMHDVESGMVDMMLAATAAAQRDGEPGMRIFSSPWSPPAWMKAPTWKDPKGALHAENMTFSSGWSCLRDGVGPTSKYAQTWALYFSKFIHACTSNPNHTMSLASHSSP
jgi:glucosylceramidase